MCRETVRISLVGIGPGDGRLLTCEAAERIREADCLIGAGRMLQCAGAYLQKEKPCFQEYRPKEIREYILEHEEYQKIVVLFSGDPGFYSGAKALYRVLTEETDGPRTGWETEILPGISSIVYLAAKLGVSWEDAALRSLHGKREPFLRTIVENAKSVFLLGAESGGEVLRKLREYGLDHVILHVGRNLSGEEESVRSGHPDAFTEEDLEGLCVLLIENPAPIRRCSPHVRDEEMLRGRVPMTKEAVRAVRVAALELSPEAVVYDIGAGTGSVSIEAALSGERIRVWAVEKNPEAAELIEQNRRKFYADGIQVVRGTAPEALEDLEAPTHVFIGGSSGNLKEILRVVKAKNPAVRIVLNAISLETVKEIMEAVEEGLLEDAEITQIQASKARLLGRYHMMSGENPIYIVSAGGRKAKGGEQA